MSLALNACLWRFLILVIIKLVHKYPEPPSTVAYMMRVAQWLGMQGRGYLKLVSHEFAKASTLLRLRLHAATEHGCPASAPSGDNKYTDPVAWEKLGPKAKFPGLSGLVT